MLAGCCAEQPTGHICQCRQDSSCSQRPCRTNRGLQHRQEAHLALQGCCLCTCIRPAPSVTRRLYCRNSPAPSLQPAPATPSALTCCGIAADTGYALAKGLDVAVADAVVLTICRSRTAYLRPGWMQLKPMHQWLTLMC